MLNSVARWLSATHVKSPRADTDGVERGGGGESVDCALVSGFLGDARGERISVNDDF